MIIIKQYYWNRIIYLTVVVTFENFIIKIVQINDITVLLKIFKV